MEPEGPLRDHGSFSLGHPNQDEIDSHHSEPWQQHAMYVGLHFPRSRGHRRRHRHRHHRRNKDEPQGQDSSKPPTPPSQRVQFILGGADDDDESHQSHDLFCEMEELRPGGEDGELEWKETARWIKFEEDVEEGGERWSKPFVATLALHSLFELRKGIMTGTVLLDMDANSLPQITDLVLENMVAHKHLEQENCDRVREVLLSRHRHQHDKQQSKGLPIIRSLADIGRKTSERKIEGGKVTDAGGHLTPGRQMSQPSLSKKNSSKGELSDTSRNESGAELSETPSTHKFNEHFAKKIPPGAEASNILVGELDFLKNPIIAFVRLSKACLLGDLTEVPVPTRFIFILLGPQGNQQRYHEIGRSIATLMSDEIFHDVAYKARNRDDLLAGIDEFLDQVTVLPPGEWDPTIRIEPPKSVPSQDSRKTAGMPNGTAVQDEEEEEHGDPTLVRSGRIFGGLVADIKRKLPFYLSDFKDGIHIQCFASFFFVYFACLTPIITFGGLLGSALDNNMAAMESLLSGAICGITYHLFAGQPLTIIGSTGPVLVFETIVYRFCFEQGWNYLAFRLWIGLWIGIILLIMVAFDLSALVRYITRFTEESFAALIALIFIVEAFKKLFHILDHQGVNLDPDIPLDYNCTCYPPTPDPNITVTTISPLLNMTELDYSIAHDAKTCEKLGGVPIGTGCETPHYVPDVFFFSCLVFIGTFTLSYSLKMFRNTRFFPNKLRSLISDFAVMIAICLMVMVDALVGLDTPKLMVPHEFEPTRKDRGWLVNPFDNPLYCLPAAIAPALLGTILIFMDQQITAVIVNRKENKLKKGSGYHLDLFIIALQIIICSILGIPWFVAATVLSINHVRSLGVESECAAPGERPKFLGVREQRVTGVVTFLMIGLSVLMGKLLGHIPMPVLFGVFLFMGVSSLKGVQLMQRITIMFMPSKYQPDYAFLRHVPLRRVHLFTAIQTACLVILWVIKTIKSISIIFPLMVLAMCFVRKSLDWLFTHHELKWLDDIMPDSHKKEKEDKLKMQGDEEIALGDEIEMTGGTVKIPLTDGGTIKVPVEKITIEPEKNQVNISEEMANTAIWKQLTANEVEKKKEKDGLRERRKKKDDGKKIHSSIAEEETEKLMPGTPDIVIDPPSKNNTPDETSPLNKTSNA